MILKKPYAFLIKHFRLINLIITLLAALITYKSYQILIFFRAYVSNNYAGSFYEGFYHDYISPIVFLVLILTILSIIIICWLLIYKKKNCRFYAVSLVYYIIILIYFIVIRNLMIGLTSELISAEVARICRDVSIIAIVTEVSFSVMFLMRFFGFNLGKYNFKEDLQELAISEQDNEEVEITLNKDTTKLKRNIRRFKREFLYYIKENKFIFTIICVVLTVLISFLIYKSLPEVVNNNYSQDDTFYMNTLAMRVEDSIITNLDYQGNVIAKDKYYLVVKLYIENTGEEEAKLDYNGFRLEIDKENYAYPEKTKGGNFIDYAKDIYLSNLTSKSSNTYALIYELNNDEIKKHYNLKINNGVSYSDKNNVGNFNFVSITPVIIDKVNIEGTYKDNEKISFINSNLKETTLKTSNLVITNNYVYDYLGCSKESCQTYKDMITLGHNSTDKSLLIMDYEYKIDESIPFFTKKQDINKFIDTFMKIKYIKGGKEYYENIKNVTPKNMQNKFALQVPKDALDSPKAYLSIIIRNKEYLIEIK